MGAERLTVVRASGHIGATVEVDLDDLLCDEDLQEDLKANLHQHMVLAFPRLNPTPAQQVELGRIFGDLQPCEEYNVSHPEHPEITVFDSDGGYKADEWHTDASWREEVPLGAVLCMRVCPSVGGDTAFSNANAAYESLSNGMKQLLENRLALHEVVPGHSFAHPVVISHPVTGKPTLFVNRIFTRVITNLPREESEAILPLLISRIAQPEFTYRHRWQEGDVLIWDNWAVQHYALFDYNERRVVNRVAIQGEKLSRYEGIAGVSPDQARHG